jgi:hypothetical protein
MTSLPDLSLLLSLIYILPYVNDCLFRLSEAVSGQKGFTTLMINDTQVNCELGYMAIQSYNLKREE